MHYRTRLLFVVSNDFGELSSALYFAKGQAYDVTVALPPRLFAVHANRLSVATCPYQTVPELLSILQRERPDVLLLFSGYLFAINRIFMLQALSILLRNALDKGCRIITSDPFLGILTGISANTFSDAHPQKERMMEHFAQANQTMRGVTHLYLADVQNPPSHPSRSFFNEQIVVPGSELAGCRQRLGQWIRVLPQTRWLFALSAEDYGLQIGLHGKEPFDFLLIRKMREAARLGRQPVLVAPQTCIDAIGAAAQIIDGAILLPFCHHDLFLTASLEAEYVFYWNVFSNSVLARVANGLPVFFFDPGHMACAIPPLYARGVDRYYSGAPLPFVSQDQELETGLLAGIAASQAVPMASAMANLRKLPGVPEVIGGILAR